MAVRTTDAKVKEIIDVDDSVSLTPFIAISNQLVTEVCGGTDTIHTEERLTIIETWLAAHFYAIRDNRLSAESLDFMEYRSEFQFKVGYDLRNTMYGQQVLIMDTSGGFAGLNNQATSGRVVGTINWLGTEYE